ncbi:MAG: hypothetical protein HY784_12175 [Chloroflexi bacterium]|nr:hypothetical protein [Chloroflexota bacterium]
MHRAFSLLAALFLLVIGGVFTRQAFTGGETLFGLRYPLPALTSINLGPLGEVSAALLLAGLVAVLIGGTVVAGIGLAIWTGRTSDEMAKETGGLPALSSAAYKGEKAPVSQPISDAAAVTLVLIGLVLGGLWASQRMLSPLPQFGLLDLGPLGTVRGDALFTMLAGALVLGTLIVGWALAFWFKRTTEEMDRAGLSAKKKK